MGQNAITQQKEIAFNYELVIKGTLMTGRRTL